MENPKKDEKENELDKPLENEEVNEENVEESILKLMETLNGTVSEKEKKKVKKLMKAIGLRKENKAQKILALILSFIESFVCYTLIYFSLIGIMYNQIKYTDYKNVIYFVLIISFYQTLFREFIHFNLINDLGKNIIYVLFLLISMFNIYFFLSVVQLIRFENTFYLILYYLLSELAHIVFSYFLVKHKIISLFR